MGAPHQLLLVTLIRSLQMWGLQLTHNLIFFPCIFCSIIIFHIFALQAQQSYETQIASLTASLAGVESDLDRVRAERSNLHTDLASVRDLNAKLDTSKEHVSRQLSAKAVELEQVRE